MVSLNIKHKMPIIHPEGALRVAVALNIHELYNNISNVQNCFTYFYVRKGSQ